MDHDRVALDHMDALWDRLVSGSASALDGQSADAEIIASLRASDAAEPDPVFARRLEAHLMNQAAQLTHLRLVSSAASPARATPPRRPAPPPARRFGHLSAVFLLLLALLTGYATYLFAVQRPEPTLSSAYLVASPAAQACPIPAPSAAPAPPSATSTALEAAVFPFNVNRQLMAGPLPATSLPAGTAPSAQTRDQIVAAVEALQTCAAADASQPAAAARTLSLFSAEFYQRGAISIYPDPWWDAYPVGLDWGQLRLDPTRIALLPNGRALALLTSLSGKDYDIALVLIPKDGSWLIDELAAIEPNATPLAPATGSKCTLPVPAVPIAPPNYSQPLSHASVLPAPITAAPVSLAAQSALPPDRLAPRPGMVARADVPPVSHPSDAALTGIVATMTDVIACQQAIANPMRAGREILGYSLAMERWSDDFLRRFAPATTSGARWFDGYPLSIPAFGDTMPTIQVLGMLPDGRALAIIRSRTDRLREYAVVFTQQNGRWLIDEMAQIAAPQPTPVASPASMSPTAAAADAAPAAGCPVTHPNGNGAGVVHPTSLTYGNDELATELWPEGIILMTPLDAAKPGGPYGMKFPWWRGAVGDLTITGRRLDGDAPPLTSDVSSGYGKHGFQASGVWFPTPGCWEVTGRVGAASLTFVTLVVVAEEPAESATATPLAPESPVSNCQATLPNGNQPPDAPVTDQWHGTSPLWTILWPTGVATIPAGLTLPDGAFVSSWDWWRGEPGELTVEARRLDGPAPLLHAVVPGVYGDSGLQRTVLFIPTAGCWQVTGRLNETTLTVVMKVVAP